MTIQLLTTTQVAEMLQIKSNTLEIARCNNSGIKIPYIRVGRNIRYRLEDVERYLTEQLSTNLSHNSNISHGGQNDQ